MVVGLLLGMLGLFGSIVVGAGTLLVKDFLPVNYAILILVALAFVVSVFTIIMEFVTGGVAGVFASGRLRGQPINMILGNDKKARFKLMTMKDGLGDVKNTGKFIVVPDSVYTAPNGTTIIISYYKYGVSLHPKFIRATTKLREANVNDIEELESLNAQYKSEGVEAEVNLDAKKG